MQPLQAVFVTCVVVSITSMLVAPAMAGYSNFVFAAQADSPGNDYKRVAGLSFDQCVTASVILPTYSLFNFRGEAHSATFR
jgi:hypothetical protein